MKTKLVLVSVVLSAGLLTSAFAGRGPGPGNGRNPLDQTEQVGPWNPDRPLSPECPNPECPYVNPDADGSVCPNPECPYLNPDAERPGPGRNPDRQPKRDGSGGPNQPENPDCPQDGSGYPW